MDNNKDRDHSHVNMSLFFDVLGRLLSESENAKITYTVEPKETQKTA